VKYNMHETEIWKNDDDDNDSGDDRSKLCTEYHIQVHACKDYTTWNINTGWRGAN